MCWTSYKACSSSPAFPAVNHPALRIPAAQALVRQASTWAELSLGFLLIVLLLTPSRNLLLLFFYWCVGRGALAAPACRAFHRTLALCCLQVGRCEDYRPRVSSTAALMITACIWAAQ